MSRPADTHIGRRTTLRTSCGKSVARRWWVEAEHVETGRIGPLGVYRTVKPDGATCKTCIKKESRR